MSQPLCTDVTGHAPHAPQHGSATDPQWIKLRIEYNSKKNIVSFLPKNKEIIACGLILQEAPNCMGLQGWMVESRKMRGNQAMLRLHVTMTPMDYSLTEVVEKCLVTITGVAFLSLLLGAATGVSEMHSLDMVLCDIKGDNFFVSVEACDKEVPIPKEAIGGYNVTVCIGDYCLALHGIEGNKSATFNHGGDSEYCRDANHLPSKSRDLYNFGRMIEILMLLGLSNGTLNLSSTLFNRLIAVAEKLQSSVPATCPTAAELVDIFAGLVKLGEQYNAPVLVEGEPEVEKESKGKEESVSVEEDKWARQLKKQLEEVSSSPPLSTARLVSLSDPGESCVNTERSQLASCGLKEEASSPELSTAALSDCTRGLKEEASSPSLSKAAMSDCTSGLRDEASSPALSSAALSDLGSRSEVNTASDNCAEEIYPYVDLYPSFVPVNTTEWSRFARCAASTRAAYTRRLCEDRLNEAPVSVDCFPAEGTFFNTASYLKMMDKEVGSGDCFPGAAAVKAAGPTWGAMGRRVVGFARTILPTW
eukprot:gene11542-34255_t